MWCESDCKIASKLMSIIKIHIHIKMNGKILVINFQIQNKLLYEIKGYIVIYG
jgi:hypothetical protein